MNLLTYDHSSGKYHLVLIDLATGERAISVLSDKEVESLDIRRGSIRRQDGSTCKISLIAMDEAFLPFLDSLYGRDWNNSETSQDPEGYNSAVNSATEIAEKIKASNLEDQLRFIVAGLFRVMAFGYRASSALRRACGTAKLFAARAARATGSTLLKWGEANAGER